MNYRPICLLLLVLVAAGALGFRLPRLERRPMHADEAVQAARFRKLWRQGRYLYDPHEFHGPTLQYATLAPVWIERPADFAETSEATYRVVPVVFGAGMVLLVWLLADGLGAPAAVCAGVLLAVSPAFVYYSRYYIHETLLVFFTLGAVAAGWRYAQSGRLAWCLAAGACLGLMQATKETSAIAYLAMAGATAIAVAGKRLGGWPCAWRGASGGWRGSSEASPRAQGPVGSEAVPDVVHCKPPLPLGEGWGKGFLTSCRHLKPSPLFFPPGRGGLRGGVSRHSTIAARRPLRHLAAGLAAAVLTAAVLLSSFGANLRGPLDGLRTYGPWLGRAGGASPHLRPWYEYLHMLAWWRPGDGPVWSEALILALAAVGLVVAVFPKLADRLGTSPKLVRWLAVYTIVATAVYSIIPYKTPWCVLTFLQGMILLAGVGAVALLRWTPTRPLKALTALLLLAATCHLAWQAYRASYVLPADLRNPYARAPTLPDVLRLAHDVEALAQAAPEGHATLVQLVWHDAYYWPLPWYLRRFERVGYWTGVPDGPGAPLVIASPQLDAAVTAKLDATHLMTGYYGVRPNVLAQLWVRMDLWEAHLRRLGRL